MHVSILAVGSRGDVQPYVALGEGLARAGHRVRVATHAPFRALVTERGLEFAEVGANPRELLETKAGLAWVSSRNGVAFFRRLGELARPLGVALANDLLRACHGTDAIVSSPLAEAGAHIAEAWRLPHVRAPLQPVSPTAAFPSILVPGATWLPAPLRRLSHRLAGFAFDLPFRAVVNGWRRDVLDLGPVRGLDFYGRVDAERQPVLYGFSSVVVPRPDDWGPWLHVCGYWSLRRQETWRPPPVLAAFLDDGPPPVYLGFGSMRVRDPAATGALVADALRRAGVRGVVGTGWAGLRAGARTEGHDAVDASGLAAGGDGVLAVGDVPHDWLFPRCTAVVHHGGAGTTATALRAGVPSFAVPFFADQLFWGRAAARLGVGPRPLPIRRLDAGALAAALRVAAGSPYLRERAAAVGRALAAEDGVATAVDVLQREVLGAA